MSPSVTITQIEVARGEMRVLYDYQTDAGVAEVNTNIFEVGNSQNNADKFETVNGDGSGEVRFMFDQGQNENVTWGVTVLIEEDGSFDQQQTDVTITADGDGATSDNISVVPIGSGGNGGGNGGNGGGDTPTQPGGLSKRELALLGAAVGGIGFAVLRRR